MNNRAGKQSRKQKLLSNRSCLSVGTWNVCTLVESLGVERVCRNENKPGNHRDDPGMIDRKLDLLVRELKRYGLSIARIQVTNGLEISNAWTLKGIPFYTLVIPCHVIKREDLEMKVLG